MVKAFDFFETPKKPEESKKGKEEKRKKAAKKKESSSEEEESSSSEEEKPTKKQKGKKEKENGKKRKAEEAAKKRTANIVAEIQGNTRAAMDPFLLSLGPSNNGVSKTASKPLLIGVKRKRSEPAPDLEDSQASKPGGTLVDYDSD